MLCFSTLWWKDSGQALDMFWVCVCVCACVFEFVELSRPPSPCLFEFVGLSILIDPICFVKEEIGFVDLCEGVRVCVCVCPCVCVCVCVFVCGMCVSSAIYMPFVCLCINWFRCGFLLYLRAHALWAKSPCTAWTQWAGVPTPARLRGASLIDMVCVCQAVPSLPTPAALRLIPRSLPFLSLSLLCVPLPLWDCE